MALRDLIAQSSAIAEESIEEVVKDYVRYDPDECEIAFTPEFAALGNKAKILVYLVALQGWRFVSDEAIVVPAKPSDIGEKLGIPGGTLRPLLKDLKDRHLIANSGTDYSVRPASLSAIKRELDQGAGEPALRSGRRKKSKAATASEKPHEVPEADTTGKGQKRGRRVATGIKAAFNEWIDEGFFETGKTLAEVQARFHEEAIIIPRTSIPTYLLGAVRTKTLSRRKQIVNGKNVWVYQSK